MVAILVRKVPHFVCRLLLVTNADFLNSRPLYNKSDAADSLHCFAKTAAAFASPGFGYSAMFRYVHFDIVGGCNAKCPYCVTARTTFGQRIQHISVAGFARTLDRLLELNLVTPKKSTIALFNWSEPLLHPNLNAIVQEACDRKLGVGISTNASKRTAFSGPTGHIDQFVFSVPGWSQASYDKIHDLKFDRVVANMEATIRNFRQTGFHGMLRLAFHAYKFNRDELPLAKQWCLEHGVELAAYTAYINDYEMMLQYRRGALPPEKLAAISENLILDYVDETIKSQPKGWSCPQFKILTLNHRSEVLLCCVLPEGHHAYSLGSVFDLSKEQILKGKTSSKECELCMSTGVAYWAHHPKVIHMTQRPRSIRKKVSHFMRTMIAAPFRAQQ